MKTRTIQIEIPEGYEIDKEKSTFENIVFKPIVKSLPKRWEDLEIINGYYINNFCEIKEYHFKPLYTNKNTLPTKELAEASLALSQLLQLREAYNDGWQPDWTCVDAKYSIINNRNRIDKNEEFCHSRVLTFKTRELKDEFLNNFRDLIEIAKPLL